MNRKRVYFIVIVSIVVLLLGVRGGIGYCTVSPGVEQETRLVEPMVTGETLSSPSLPVSSSHGVVAETLAPSPSGTEKSPSPSATGRGAASSPSVALSSSGETPTLTPPILSTSQTGVETPSSPGEIGASPSPLAKQKTPPPSPTASSEADGADGTGTEEAFPEPRSMYLGMGDTLLFQGKGFAFEVRLTTSDAFREDYAAAYSSIYIDRAVRGNVNLSIHSSTWAGKPNPGEILLRAYTGGALKRGDELLWKNRATGEALTLIFIGARLGIPTGEFEQFHELPEHLRREIGREFIDEHPESRAARLIRNGYTLTIVTCDSRPGHMEIRRDGSVAFPEQTGFVFVYY